MSPRTFFRLFALVPILVPLAIGIVALLSPRSLPGPLVILYLSVAGLPFYLPFAAVLFWLLRNRSARDHQRWSYWVPLAFAGVVFVGWFGWFIVSAPESPTSEMLEDSAAAAAYALVLGYGYVVAMHVAFVVACALGAVRLDPGSSPRAAA